MKSYNTPRDKLNYMRNLDIQIELNKQSKNIDYQPFVPTLEQKNFFLDNNLTDAELSALPASEFIKKKNEIDETFEKNVRTIANPSLVNDIINKEPFKDRTFNKLFINKNWSLFVEKLKKKFVSVDNNTFNEFSKEFIIKNSGQLTEEQIKNKNIELKIKNRRSGREIEGELIDKSRLSNEQYDRDNILKSVVYYNSRINEEYDRWNNNLKWKGNKGQLIYDLIDDADQMNDIIINDLNYPDKMKDRSNQYKIHNEEIRNKVQDFNYDDIMDEIEREINILYNKVIDTTEYLKNNNISEFTKDKKFYDIIKKTSSNFTLNDDIKEKMKITEVKFQILNDRFNYGLSKPFEKISQKIFNKINKKQTFIQLKKVGYLNDRYKRLLNQMKYGKSFLRLKINKEKNNRLKIILDNPRGIPINEQDNINFNNESQRIIDELRKEMEQRTEYLINEINSLKNLININGENNETEQFKNEVRGKIQEFEQEFGLVKDKLNMLSNNNPLIINNDLNVKLLIDDLEKKILNDVVNQVNQLKSENEKQFNETNERIGKAEEVLKSNTQDIQEIKNSLNTLLIDINELKKNYIPSNNNIEQIKEQIKKMIKDFEEQYDIKLNDKLKNQLEDINKEITNKNNEIKKLISDTGEQLSELKKDITSIKDNLLEFKKDINAMKEELSDKPSKKEVELYIQKVDERIDKFEKENNIKIPEGVKKKSRDPSEGSLSDDDITHIIDPKINSEENFINPDIQNINWKNVPTFDKLDDPDKELYNKAMKKTGSFQKTFIKEMYPNGGGFNGKYNKEEHILMWINNRETTEKNKYDISPKERLKQILNPDEYNIFYDEKKKILNPEDETIINKYHLQNYINDENINDYIYTIKILERTNNHPELFKPLLEAYDTKVFKEVFFDKFKKMDPKNKKDNIYDIILNANKNVLSFFNREDKGYLTINEYLKKKYNTKNVIKYSDLNYIQWPAPSMYEFLSSTPSNGDLLIKKFNNYPEQKKKEGGKIKSLNKKQKKGGNIKSLNKNQKKAIILGEIKAGNNNKDLKILFNKIK